MAGEVMSVEPTNQDEIPDTGTDMLTMYQALDTHLSEIKTATQGIQELQSMDSQVYMQDMLDIKEAVLDIQTILNAQYQASLEEPAEVPETPVDEQPAEVQEEPVEPPPENVPDEVPQYITDIQTSLSAILEHAEKAPDYTEQLKQISEDLQTQVRMTILTVFAIGIVSGVVAGSILWRKFHAG